MTKVSVGNNNMDKDSLAIHLEGKVSLDDFAKAISKLSSTLRAIEKDITGKNEIDWLVTDLHLSSDETPVRSDRSAARTRLIDIL